jgi:soluble cytochrome b562
MRVFLLSIGFFCCSVLADAAVDLEKTMKSMAFQYKQACETQHSSELILRLDEFIGLTELALQANFSADKAAQFKQGLQQVLQTLHAAKKAALLNDMPLAKNHLRQVDKLRKDYHKQREVSIWQLLFG